MTSNFEVGPFSLQSLRQALRTTIASVKVNLADQANSPSSDVNPLETSSFATRNITSSAFRDRALNHDQLSRYLNPRHEMVQEEISSFNSRTNNTVSQILPALENPLTDTSTISDLPRNSRTMMIPASVYVMNKNLIDSFAKKTD